MLHDQLYPHFQRCWEANVKRIAVKKDLAAGEECVADRQAAAKEEHDLPNTLRKTAAKFYLCFDE